MRAKNPGGHCEQTVAPQELADPAAQSAHSIEPAALQLPGPHGEHDMDVVTASSSAPDLPRRHDRGREGEGLVRSTADDKGRCNSRTGGAALAAGLSGLGLEGARRARGVVAGARARREVPLRRRQTGAGLRGPGGGVVRAGGAWTAVK